MPVIHFSMSKKQLCSPRNPSGILAKNISQESFGKANKDDFDTNVLDQYLMQYIDENINGGLNLSRVCFMIHDMNFDPADQEKKLKFSINPHRRIFKHYPVTGKKNGKIKAYSWPTALHLNDDAIEKTIGLGIAFGWKSNGDDKTFLKDFFNELLKNAENASWGLFQLIKSVQRIMPNTPVHFVVNGLGSEVVIPAIEKLLDSKDQDALLNLRTLQLLGASSPVSQVEKLTTRLNEHNSNLDFEIFNYMNPEDDHLNRVSEIYETAKVPQKVLGIEGTSSNTYKNWIDIQLNHPIVTWWIRKFLRIDIKVNDSDNIRDHTLFYRHLPNMILFRQIAWENPDYSIEALRKKGLPEGRKSNFLPFLKRLLGIDD
jgi:hypothetical protein